MVNSESQGKGVTAGLAAALTFLGVTPFIANAQQLVNGFAVERFYPSAPGGGWFVMDDLNLSGGLGGAIEVTSGYARNPLKVTSPDGTQHLVLVSDQGFVDVGVAATYDPQLSHSFPCFRERRDGRRISTDRASRHPRNEPRHCCRSSHGI